MKKSEFLKFKQHLLSLPSFLEEEFRNEKDIYYRDFLFKIVSHNNLFYLLEIPKNEKQVVFFNQFYVGFYQKKDVKDKLRIPLKNGVFVIHNDRGPARMSFKGGKVESFFYINGVESDKLQINKLILKEKFKKI